MNEADEFGPGGTWESNPQNATMCPICDLAVPLKHGRVDHHVLPAGTSLDGKPRPARVCTGSGQLPRS